MRSILTMLCLMLATAPIAYAAKIKTTADLVSAMQKKYGKSWYQTATFVQKTTDYDKDGNQKVSTWYEALAVPGSLRIDSRKFVRAVCGISTPLGWPVDPEV